MDDLYRCGQGYREFARDNATYYSLMFDRVVPDFRPSERRQGSGARRPRSARRPGAAGDGRRAAPGWRRLCRRRRDVGVPARSGVARRRAPKSTTTSSTGTASPRSPSRPCFVGWPPRRDPGLRSCATRVRRVARALRRLRDRAGPRPALAASMTSGSARYRRARSTASSPTVTARGSTTRRCCSIRERWRCGSRPATTASSPSERGVPNAGRGPLAVARPAWPERPSRRSSRPPVVYEAHVRGLTRRAGGRHPGTFAALHDQLPRLAALGVTVVELMPVHQNDPAEGSYWGYMPLAFAAIHRQYAAGADAAAELAAFVAAAHVHDIEVWLDVVYNHTTEVDATGPTYHLRGLSDGAFYRLRDDGSYIETTGCGNDLEAESSAAQDLIIWSLDRLADLGVDGFRFDLASVLSRSRGLIERFDEWAARQIGRDDRRALGCRRHLRGRADVARRRVAAVERPLPRRRPRVPAGGAGHGPDRSPAHPGESRHVRCPDGERQLHRRPRRLHALRRVRLRPQAQRRQRSGRHRRDERQPVLEQRLGG